jgi:hypothetical protein
MPKSHMMESHGCNYVDAPISDLQFDTFDLGNVTRVTDMGRFFQAKFQKEDYHFIPNLDKLKLGFA